MFNLHRSIPQKLQKSTLEKLQCKGAYFENIEKLKENPEALFDTLVNTIGTQEKNIEELKATIEDNSNNYRHSLDEAKRKHRRKVHALEKKVSEMKDDVAVEKEHLEEVIEHKYKRQKEEKVNEVREEKAEKEHALAVAETKIEKLTEENEFLSSLDNTIREKEATINELKVKQAKAEQKAEDYEERNDQLQKTNKALLEKIQELGGKDPQVNVLSCKE